MFRGIVFVVAVLVGGMILVHMALSNGSFIKYLDENPDPRWVPTTEYYVGQGYYLFQDLPNAATYFWRIPERYPKSPLADDGFFAYLQCLEDTLGMPRDILITEDQKYLDRYPEGQHVSMIRDRIDTLRSGAR